MALKLSFPLIAGLCVAATAAVAFTILDRPDSASRLQVTDDAYVQADATNVALQIAGRIEKILVEENQQVVVGAPLVEIDDRELRIALDAARARLAQAEAALNILAAQTEQQQSYIKQAAATLDADQASLGFAVADRTRFANLARDGAGPRQAAEEAESRWRNTSARQQADQAALDAARKQIDVFTNTLARATAERDAAEAARQMAELTLSYAHVAAPVTGVVTQKRARVGAYAQIGETLLTLVPLRALYIDANYRETQLAHVWAGQKVRIEVDALPGETFEGEVESLAPASGVSFSAVPPHNATGNFTKITQRLPVRIKFADAKKAGEKLKVGMSVKTSITAE